MKKTGEKYYQHSIKKVIVMGAMSIIGVKQGKNKEKGKKPGYRIQETGDRMKGIGRSGYRGVGIRHTIDYLRLNIDY